MNTPLEIGQKVTLPKRHVHPFMNLPAESIVISCTPSLECTSGWLIKIRDHDDGLDAGWFDEFAKLDDRIFWLMESMKQLGVFSKDNELPFRRLLEVTIINVLAKLVDCGIQERSFIWNHIYKIYADSNSIIQAQSLD